MNLKHAVKLTVFVVGLFALTALRPSGAAAQAAHAHSPAAAAAQQGASDQDKAGALVRIVREATERFQDVEVAKAEGYALQFGCVSGSLDPNFVAPGAIEWLRLDVSGDAFGPTGGDKVERAAYIQRVNTVGGVKPASAECTASAINTRRLVSYQADYYFYR